MGYNIYNADGSLFASSISGGGAGGGGSSTSYDRMDVGILALQQLYQPGDIYDFRVPGDANRRTFQYKFPRNGFLLGVSITGSVSQTVQGAIYVTKLTPPSINASDVMTPSDPGNTQIYDVTNFPNTGMVIMAPTPIPYSAGDLAQGKFKSFASSQVTVNLAGFLIIGLVPQ